MAKPQLTEERARKLVDQLRPYVQSEGGELNLLRLEPGGTVVLDLLGPPHFCLTGRISLKLAIERRFHEEMREVAGVVVEERPEES